MAGAKTAGLGAMRGMPRRSRDEGEGRIHHVWARGVELRDVFMDDADRARYLDLLGKVVARRGWVVLAYCLMGNHLHLLIETPEPNLGLGMQWLQGRYAQGFNRKYGRTGHLFESRYGSKPMRSDAQLWVTAAYIALNPVDAGLVPDAGEWQWSSQGAVARGVVPNWLRVDRLWEFFGSFGGDGARRFLSFLADRAAAALGRRQATTEARRETASASSGSERWEKERRSSLAPAPET
jgi:putative transposase